MPKQRLAWLDALRAVAAFLVVYAHLSRYLFTGARAVSAEWLHAGPAGVMLFFLVSGYIVPASLERHGDLRRFWVGRVFRLLPLYLTVTVLVVGLGVAGVVPLDPFLSAHPVTAAVGHVTMLPFLLGVPLATPVLWTLSYEMAFYLLVTCFFVLKTEKSGRLAVRAGTSPAAIAILLAVVAVGIAPLHPHLLSRSPASTSALVALIAVLLVAGLAAVTTSRSGSTAAQPATAGPAAGRGMTRTAGALVLGGLAVVLLVANQDPAHVWDGLLIVAVMFTGTVIHGGNRKLIAITSTVVGAALIVNWFAELRSLDGFIVRYEVRSFVTLAVFGGAFAIGCVTRRAPGFLAWLGKISYSIYLVHYVLIQLTGPYLARLHGIAQVPGLLAYLGLLIGLSWLAYRFVEVPGQGLANRVRERLRNRTPAPEPPVPAGPTARR